MADIKPLLPEQTHRTCDLSSLGFKTTQDIELSKEMVGQKRATDTILLGIGIEKSGYNLYLSGEPELGKKTYIKSILKEIAPTKPTPNDWCYVYNFENPREPKALELAAGDGKKLKRDMNNLINVLKSNIPQAFESKEFEEQKNQITQEYNTQREAIFNELRKFALSRNIQIQFTPTGIVAIPLLNNRPLSQADFEKLDEELKKEILERKKEVDTKIAETLKRIRKLDKEFTEKIKELENTVASITVKGLIDNLKEEYAEYPAVIEYLDAVYNDIINHIEKFLPQQQPQPFFPITDSSQPAYSKPLLEYDVNVFVDNSRTQGAPVIFEPHPNYTNMFGTIERELVMGAMVTNFTLIRAGSICKANGGYLVVDVYDVLKFPFVWDTLKKVLENKKLRIEDMFQHSGYTTGPGLTPEPIKIDVKVIMTGPRYLYSLLYHYDPDFKKLFKVKADFDTEIDWNEENLNKYAWVIKSICSTEKLKDLDRSGVEAVIEYSARLADNQEKLSVHFGSISKVLIEADYWASQDSSSLIQRKHVEKAIEEKIYRSRMIEEKIQELIAKGIIKVQTEGEVVGQINAISVYDLGDYSFGKPSRITCETFMGTEGVVNIERKAKLSGNIHDKGVLILSGYLGRKYAQSIPLSVSASIGFEQSYSIIDGDSASAAELIALLSSLAEVPIKQNLAITGSVDQKGTIQPIGGVNEKIEGFFETCKAKGLTGNQGVVIPIQNVKNLMLKKEVREAIEKKKFHIYPIETIDEGLEIMTGQKAGKKKPDGTYEEGTIHHLVSNKLYKLAKELKSFGSKSSSSKENDEEKQNES